MLKRLPFLALAILIGIASCLHFGGRVSAASPIIYGGSVSWAVGRRDTFQGVDFNYSTFDSELPYYGSTGHILPQLIGIPSNRSTSTFDRFPAYVAVKSRELRANGGYLYLGFVIAYSSQNTASWTSATFTSSQVKAYLSLAGSLSYAVSNGYSLSLSQVTTTSGSNTTLSIDLPTDYGTIFSYGIRGNERFSGSNIPKVAYLLSGGTQYLSDAGLDYLTLYDFGDTSVDWNKLAYYQCRIYVEPNTGSLQDTVWVNLTDAIRGSFKSVASQADFTYGDTLLETVDCYLTNCIYLCPVFCYATSQVAYDTIPEALADISAKLDSLSVGSVSQSVLESYAALGSQAREEAASAASAMAQVYPTYDPSAMDVSNLMDSTAKAQFKSIVGFLGNQKILPIIGAVFTLVLIGFVFFGKK